MFWGRHQRCSIRLLLINKNPKGILRPILMLLFCDSLQVLEQHTVLQKEVTQSVAEMVKSHKSYAEEEHVAHESRTKTQTVEDK